ncbi:MAG: hypothetical protein KU29_05370 [Sulfurovum sp. FS06-10]|nr:MAG: hypothetical protein KU29_05370 [Sulfurovum sp. FS06-10]
MTKENVHKELETILKTAKKINYNDVVLYLIDKSKLDSILQLELTVRMDNEENGIKKKNHFYEFAKIINTDFPAFKYSLSMKHKKKEIFDPAKVKQALPIEFEIWKNKSRSDLEKQIKEPNSNITDDHAYKLRVELEKEIAIAQENIQKVLENFTSYDVIISTFEYYTYYPSLYYVIEEKENKKSQASDTHLRKEVPNLLWFEDERPYTELRSNDRMSRIIQTFDRFCGTVYIKEK